MTTAPGRCAVHARTGPQEAVAAAGAAFLLAVGAAFVVSGAGSPSSFGGVLSLLIGVPGIAVFGGRLVMTAGRALSGRPVLELDEREVRLPAAWPWSRAHDRRLAWPEVAAVVVWSRTVPRGRSRPVEHVTFLPTAERAARDRPPPSAELVALHLDDLPGTPTLRWSAAVPRRSTPPLDAVIAEVRRLAAVRVLDARSR